MFYHSMNQKFDYTSVADGTKQQGQEQHLQYLPSVQTLQLLELLEKAK